MTIMQAGIALAIAASAAIAAPAPSPTPPVVITGAESEARDSFVVDASSSAWKQTADGREPADNEPQDRYLRADATACLTFDDLEAVQAITTAPGACPQNTTEAQITP
ncbi:hypothetical protein, partial [Isoptericola sp. NPDC057191]|uniref:hypothetical protein n=1 Tax=Isoptericola sp. NPDC057191 TaxID=3346041 RepID=UPI003642D145